MDTDTYMHTHVYVSVCVCVSICTHTQLTRRGSPTHTLLNTLTCPLTPNAGTCHCPNGVVRFGDKSRSAPQLKARL